MRVTIYPDLLEEDGVDGLPVFVGFIHGKLRFGGKGGADIRRNHPAYRRIWGIHGNAPTLMAGQTEYYIAYGEDRRQEDGHASAKR